MYLLGNNNLGNHSNQTMRNLTSYLHFISSSVFSPIMTLSLFLMHYNASYNTCHRVPLIISHTNIHTASERYIHS